MQDERPVQRPIELARMTHWLRVALCQPGAVAECGVFSGGAAVLLATVMAKEVPPRPLHLLDVWEQYTTDSEVWPGNRKERKRIDTGRTDNRKWGTRQLGDVRARLAPYDNVIFHPGWFEDTFPALTEPLCFIHADADLEASTRTIIALADRLLVPGGVIVFHDDRSSWGGVTKAVDDDLSPEQYDILVPRPKDGTYQCVAMRRWP